MSETEKFEEALKQDDKRVIVPLIQIPTSKIRDWFSKLFGGGDDSN